MDMDRALAADEIGREVGLVIARADVAHDAMQVTEVVDAQDDVLGSECKATGKQALVQRAEVVAHHSGGPKPAATNSAKSDLLQAPALAFATPPGAAWNAQDLRRLMPAGASRVHDPLRAAPISLRHGDRSRSRIDTRRA